MGGLCPWSTPPTCGAPPYIRPIIRTFDKSLAPTWCGIASSPYIKQNRVNQPSEWSVPRRRRADRIKLQPQHSQAESDGWQLASHRPDNPVQWGQGKPLPSRLILFPCSVYSQIPTSFCFSLRSVTQNEVNLEAITEKHNSPAIIQSVLRNCCNASHAWCPVMK